MPLTNVKKNKNVYTPSKEKMKNSLKYWEQSYRVRLKPNVIKKVLKDATLAIQNRKQISAFMHGLVVGLLKERANYTTNTKVVLASQKSSETPKFLNISSSTNRAMGPLGNLRSNIKNFDSDSKH
jgi:hypothetical protein